jgi:hypothetical protein
MLPNQIRHAPCSKIGGPNSPGALCRILLAMRAVDSPSFPPPPLPRPSTLERGGEVAGWWGGGERRVGGEVTGWWLGRVFHQCSIHRPDLNRIELPEKTYIGKRTCGLESRARSAARQRPPNRRGVRSSELRSENKRRFLQKHIHLECYVLMEQMNRLERLQRCIASTSERRRERLQRISDLYAGVLFVQTDASINLKPIANQKRRKSK